MVRSCGVLLPVSSLPSKYGIGTFGTAAYAFVDFLKESGQEYWQMLPLLQTGYGDSPYHSVSVFAGNPYFIDLELLMGEGLLTREECDCDIWSDRDDEINYSRIYQSRFKVLMSAFTRSGYEQDCDFRRFKEYHSEWLDDYALYMALKSRFYGQPWSEWPLPVRFRHPDAMDDYRKRFQPQIEFWNYVQYLFFTQYQRLKAYANAQGIKLIGDMPIYVALDSADVWGKGQLFLLDSERKPISVAGVPPDYFSKTGQLWGNPVYDWKGHSTELYQWWQSRLQASLKLYDTVRIDHFRAFDEYYAVPAEEETAVHGTWEEGPGPALFETMKERLGYMDIIAEDLGIITDTVQALLKRTGFPGMKVLQFGLRATEDSPHLPHNYVEHSVAYTGTHDNDTLNGWYCSADHSDREFALKYFRARSDDDFSGAAISGLYASPARLVIVPIQDWLGLGGEARINTPSTSGGNWTWRLCPGALTPALARKMKEISATYRRSGFSASGIPI